jgi:hypothetical protein
MSFTKLNAANGKADRVTAFINSLSASERHNLADSLSAATASMTIEEKKQLLDAFKESVSAEESKKSLASIRAAKMTKAMKMENPFDQTNVKSALRQMQRLGLNIDQIAASGDVKAVDRAMTEAGWKNTERMALKVVLANIGVID